MWRIASASESDQQPFVISLLRPLAPYSHITALQPTPARMTSPKLLRVLILTKTSGYRHASIPASVAAIRSFGTATGDFITTTHAETAAVICEATLAQHDVVMFLQTTGEFLDEKQVAELRGFVRRGGGFVGVHAASGGLGSESWYAELIGARFTNHPEPSWGRLKVEHGAHQAFPGITAGLPKEDWPWYDEWYNFDVNPRDKKVNVVLSVDEGQYSGGTMGRDHPLAWYREFDGGRSFYTALGHFAAAYDDEKFMTHLWRGILWAGGVERADPLIKREEDRNQ